MPQPRTQHNFNRDLPRDTEVLTGQALLAQYNEDMQLLVDKLKAGNMTQAEFLDAQAEINAKASGLNLSSIREHFDHAVATGILIDQRKNAVAAYKNCLMLVNELITTVNDPATPDFRTISNKELFAMFATAGGMSTHNFTELLNVSSSDIDSAEMLTDPTVHYVIKPLSLINVYPRRSITTTQIRELVPDPDKQLPAAASGGTAAGFKTVAEAAAFAEVKLGTKDVTRDLHSFGAFWKMFEEWLMDSNRAHFLPYATTRLREEFMIKLEEILYLGSDAPAANTVIGFSEEAGIQERAAALAAGVWTSAHINAFCDAIAAIATDADAYGMANWIFLYPKDYAKLLQSWEANVGYLFAPPAGVTGGPPVGRTIPTLFGVPIAQSQALDEGTMWVTDLSDSSAVFNGGEYRTQEGLINDDLATRGKSMVMKTLMTQFSRFAKKFYKITQTQR